MPHPVVVFEGVSKKFRRGERHTSLRDLVPALVRSTLGARRQPALHQDEFWALRDVSFEVEPGKALGIIGPNGAGKSTTLKILTRILKPTTGHSSTTGRVGALIEVASGFHPDLSGRENVFLQGAIMGMKRAEIERRFDQIVEFAGLPEYMDTPVKRYSSCMNARLGFSIAAHLNPQVLIIDEVLSVGDMAFQQKCFDRMLDFKRQGVAIVLVSHNLQAVAALCDSALYLDHRMIAIGSVPAVIDQYLKQIGSDRMTSIGSEQVEVTSCQLSDLNGHRPESVKPGVRLRLRLMLHALKDVSDFTFYFRLRRSTDQLLVYDGHVASEEAECGLLQKGESVAVDFVFSVNLTRGHYYVEVQAFHKPTQSFLIRINPAASFIVDEMRSHAGIADVQLEARASA